jgi:hypothetical protein
MLVSLLIPKFASSHAAQMGELRNRDTSSFQGIRLMSAIAAEKSGS